MTIFQFPASCGRSSGPGVLGRPLSGWPAGFPAVSPAACSADEASNGASGDTSSDGVTKAVGERT